MDRSLIVKNIRRPNRLGHLFTRRRWNQLRDAVKNKMYSRNNEKSLNSAIYEAPVDPIDYAEYVPTENVRYMDEQITPLTSASIFNPLQNIDNYSYRDNINLGENVKIGTVEGYEKQPFLSRIESSIIGRRRNSLPPIERIPAPSSPIRQIAKKNAGSKVNRRISSKRKNKRVKKTYKKKMYKI